MSKDKKDLDLHQISISHLINLIGTMTTDQLRSILPDFHQYYQARKATWNLVRQNTPPSDTTLEVEAFIAIMKFQSLDWSRTEIENKILDIFGRIKEQEEIILYEIQQEIEQFK
jgi:hypothetical protein